MMKKIFSVMLIMLAAFTTITLQSCKDDDTPYVPYVPEATKPILSGTVTTNGGDPLEGATVKVGTKTATTDANGQYSISDLTAGEVEVVISNGKDYSEASEKVTLKNNTVSVVNAILVKANIAVPKYNVADPTVTETNIVDAIYTADVPSVVSTITSENTMVATIVVEDKSEMFKDSDDDFVMSTSIEYEVTGSRAAKKVGEGISLLNISTKSGKAPKKAFKVAIKSAETAPSRVLYNNKEIPANQVVNNGNYYYFMATELGRADFVFDIMSENAGNGSDICLDTKISGPVSSQAVTIDYKQGTSYTNNESSLMNFIALFYGSIDVKDAQCSVNMQVPLGTIAQILATQAWEKKSYFYATNAKMTPIIATAYGDLTIKITDERQHTGGSN